MQTSASIAFPEMIRKNSQQINDKNLNDLIANFHNVEPAEKEMFNLMIEQEFENFFSTIRGLKERDKTYNGAKKRIDETEEKMLWILSIPFIYWIFNPSELVFLLSLCLIPIILFILMSFCILMNSKRGVLYRVGIKDGDLSLKAKYKMIFLLKMFAYCKYSTEQSKETMLDDLIKMFAENHFPKDYFNELLKDAFKIRDDEVEKNKRRQTEIQKEKALNDEIMSLSNSSIEIEAKLEVLKYFTENMEKIKKNNS